MPPANEHADGSRAVALGTVVALGAVFGLHRLIDPDFFQQVAVGRAILADPGSLGASTFVHAYPSYRYVEDKWLPSVVVGVLDRVGGADALMLYQVAVAVLVALAWYGMQRAWGTARLAAVAGTTLALVACSFRIEPRPDTLSHVLLAATIALTIAPWPLRRALVATALLTALWVNVHGYYVNGLLVLAAAAVAASLGDRALAATPLRPRERVLLVAVATAACIVHPQGWRALWSPLEQLLRLRSEAHFRAAIQELGPATQLLAGAGWWHWAALLAGAVAGAALTRRRGAHDALVRQAVGLAAVLPWLVLPPPGLTAYAYRVTFALLVLALFEIPRLLAARRLFAPLLLVGFAVLAAAAVRNVPLVIPAALVVLGPMWTAIVADRKRARRPLLVRAPALGVAVLVAVVVWMRLADRLDTDVRAPIRTGWGIDERRFPAQAIDFVLRENVAGPFLNNFDSGGYLLYRLHPGAAAFIAGNTSMFPTEFLEYYRARVTTTPDLADIVRRFGVQAAILDFATSATNQLVGALARSPDWRLAFFDRAGAVFVRGDPAVGALDVAGRARAVAVEDDASHGLPTWLGGARLPYPSFNLAHFLAALGRPDLAATEAARVWQSAPAEEVAVLGGRFARDAGRLVDFLPTLDAAETRFPASAAIRELLALALAFRAETALNAGTLADAKRDLERMLTLQPDACGPYVALAKVAALARDVPTAMTLLGHSQTRDRDGMCVRSAAADPILRPLLAP